MNRLTCFTTLFFLLVSSISFSQDAYLFVKKGYKKKKIYIEGDPIKFRLRDGSYYSGTITLLRNDTVFINDVPVRCSSIREIVLDKRPAPPFPDAKTLLLIGAGSALVTTGLTLSKQTTFKKGLEYGLIIGYAPILIRYLAAKFFKAIVRTRYKMGRKFHLQVLDFHLPPNSRKPF
jgi:hypothetical protein